MYLNLSVSLKMRKKYLEIAVCEKNAGQGSGNSSDLSSACFKALLPIKIFQFSDMHYETERYRSTTYGLI